MSSPKLISRNEFCVRCSIKSKDLSNYIKRNKVVLTDDMVDLSNELNRAFLEKRIEIKGEVKFVPPVEVEVVPEKVVKPKKEPAKKPVEIKEKPVVEVKKQVIPTPNKPDPNGLVELERQMKQEQLKKLKLESESRRIKNEREAGKTMPIDMIVSMLKQHNAAIVTSFRNGADILIGEFAKKKDLTNAEQAAMNGVLVDVINKAMNNATQASQRLMDGVVAEFSQKLERGEKAL